MSSSQQPAVSSVPTDILSQLKRDEGFTRFPKPDSHNTLEIGYGFNINLAGLYQNEADAILPLRVARIRNSLAAALPAFNTLDMARMGVLLNMSFEMGVDEVLRWHKMLGHMWNSEWPDAAAEIRASLYYTEVTERAERLARQMESGEWQ